MIPAEQPPDRLQRITAEHEASYRSGDVTLEYLCRQPGSFFLPYAGKWIAAKDCQILAAAANHRELMAQLYSDENFDYPVVEHYTTRKSSRVSGGNRTLTVIFTGSHANLYTTNTIDQHPGQESNPERLVRSEI
jgi:hypothetical protein